MTGRPRAWIALSVHRGCSWGKWDYSDCGTGGGAMGKRCYDTATEIQEVLFVYGRIRKGALYVKEIFDQIFSKISRQRFLGLRFRLRAWKDHGGDDCGRRKTAEASLSKILCFSASFKLKKTHAPPDR
jgi:hypothetical protein